MRGPPQLWHQGREGESREAISIAERQLRQVYIVSPLSKQVILRCDRLENDQAPRMHHSESVDFNRRKLGDDREHPVEDPPLVAIGRALRRDQIDDNFGRNCGKQDSGPLPVSGRARSPLAVRLRPQRGHRR